MKKFTLDSILFIILFLFSFCAIAQKPDQQTGPKRIQRCGTMEWYEEMFKANPAFKAEFEANQAKIAERAARSGANRTTALIDTIPVAVHIVLNNSAVVTDATVQSQIDVLNEDYRGLNADSTLIPAAFKPLFGKAGIFFMLAKQDPDGDPTTAIERRNSSVAIGLSVSNENIKHFSSGGLEAWDPCRYLNLWVGQDPQGQLLGSSVFPGTPAATVPGYVCDYRSFGRGAAYLYTTYNKGRTATHELGHFLNLRHIWGDEAGCTGTDFPNSTYGNGTDDTPNQGAENYGCPTGVKVDACSPSAPGVMYMNYMDYTDDACMMMFTKGQGERMDASLLFAPDRSCLLNSLTYQAPIVFPNDALIKTILNPANGSTSCNNSVIPQFTLRNRGTNTLTSVILNMKLDNNAVVSTPWTGSLASFQDLTLTLPSIALAPGAHTLKIYTTLPNNVVDPLPAKDTATSLFSVGVGVALPLFENFETLSFPPNGWRVINPDNALTWARRTGALGLPGNTGSAWLNAFNYSARGQVDILHSPIVSVAGADSVFIEFDNSYRQYGTAAADADSLEVVVSADCGTTFQRVWVRGGADLATVTPSTTAGWVPALASDWVRRKLDLSAYASLNNIIIGFRSISKYGNNIYLDNVNITKVVLPSRDLRPIAFTNPFNTLCENNNNTNVRPVIQIANLAKDTIRTFVVNYTIDNGAPATVNYTGTFPKGQVVSVQLNAATFAVGNHTIKAWTSLPNGLADQVPSNDTLTFSFQVIATVAAPLVEGFENSAFPPANWTITQQPADGFTWTRTTQSAKTGNASALINNFNYAANDRVDNLLTPSLTYTGADSVFLKFDVAASTYSFPGSTAIPLDTLEVLVTTDCGRTFTSLYKKFGTDLQTTGEANYPNTDEFFPKIANQWRTDSINVTRLLGGSNSVRFMFRNTTNYENNIFLDNINFTPKVLPAKLKQNGFMITPNPFSSRFAIQHYLPPTDLRGYGVYNSIGQLVMSRSYGEGMADSYIEVNMSQMPSGMYTIKLMYSGKTVSQKIVKVN